MSAAGPQVDGTPPPRAFSAARFEARLWLAQRVSALVLAVCVVVHLATIMLAVRGGLSADEILTRLRSSPAWLAFYVVFVASVAVHAPLGLRAVAGDAGCQSCHTHVSCTERCPKQISPTAGIAGLKRAVAKAAWKGEL